MLLRKRIVCALLFTLAAGCGDDDNEDQHANGGAPTEETVVPTDPLTGEEITVVEAMNIALQGEFLAEETYRVVVEDFGPIQPFASIITAETKHSDAFTVLYEARGLDVPASEWNSGNIPHYPTLQEACAAGVVIEQATVERYDRFLFADLPADVERVFTNLRDAARDRHLPAFLRCDGTPVGRGR